MRLIDADALIEEINKRIKSAYEWYDEVQTEEVKIRAEQAIATFCEASLTAKKMPIIEPEPHWIPCSERLPEIDSDGYSDKVLVCFQNFVGIEICEYRVIDGRGKWYVGDLDVSPEDVGIVVLAWMPLPEAYKEET